MTTQLITPNPNIPCTPGLCLVYVRETFGVGPKYPTATAGWNASNHKHPDQNFPEGDWVPVWFSLNDDPDGHVALRQPDGSIWSSSSPTATKPVHHQSLDAIEKYYGGRLNYLGWTNDIEGAIVTEDPGVQPSPEKHEIRFTTSVPWPLHDQGQRKNRSNVDPSGQLAADASSDSGATPVPQNRLAQHQTRGHGSAPVDSIN